jgi:prepilin-type N-terminal cleavage/methylation domain-containing protein
MKLRLALCRLVPHKNGASAAAASGYAGAMKRGFTLAELLLVLAVAGILISLATPRLLQDWDRVQVAAAAAHLVAAHQRARIMAIARGQALVLAIDSAALVITPRAGSAVLWSEPGPATFRVALPGATRRITFAPEGFTLGLSNASLQLSRGAATRTVVFSRLGRVRVLQ